MTVAMSSPPAPPPEAAALWSQTEICAARPCNRSSKIFGSAKVVAWKMIEETAVVMKTMAATRISSAR